MSMLVFTGLFAIRILPRITSLDVLVFHTFLELQTTIYKWMFGETTISYVKIGNHPIETTIYKWLFGVPGWIALQIKERLDQNLHPMFFTQAVWKKRKIFSMLAFCQPGPRKGQKLLKSRIFKQKFRTWTFSVWLPSMIHGNLR